MYASILAATKQIRRGKGTRLTQKQIYSYFENLVIFIYFKSAIECIEQKLVYETDKDMRKDYEELIEYYKIFVSSTGINEQLKMEEGKNKENMLLHYRNDFYRIAELFCREKPGIDKAKVAYIVKRCFTQ